MKHLWLARFQAFHDLETNPETQLRVHTIAQRFWMSNVPVFVGWFFVSPRTFIGVGVFLTGLYSLYANWATDNGAAVAARTLINSTPSNKEVLAAVEEVIDSPTPHAGL